MRTSSLGTRRLPNKPVSPASPVPVYSGIDQFLQRVRRPQPRLRSSLTRRPEGAAGALLLFGSTTSAPARANLRATRRNAEVTGQSEKPVADPSIGDRSSVPRFGKLANRRIGEDGLPAPDLGGSGALGRSGRPVGCPAKQRAEHA